MNVSDLPGITICYRERLLFFFRNKFTLQSSTMMECRAPNINGILWAELPPLGVNSRKILTVLCVFFALQSVIFLGGCTTKLLPPPALLSEEFAECIWGLTWPVNLLPCLQRCKLAVPQLCVLCSLSECLCHPWHSAFAVFWARFKITCQMG